MVYLDVRTLKDRRFTAVIIALACGPLLASLCFAVAQTSNPKIR